MRSKLAAEFSLIFGKSGGFELAFLNIQASFTKSNENYLFCEDVEQESNYGCSALILFATLMKNLLLSWTPSSSSTSVTCLEI